MRNLQEQVKKHSVTKHCFDLSLFEQIVLVISKNSAFLTYSWRFLISNKLEQLKFKLEKILGFTNMQEKLEKTAFS